MTKINFDGFILPNAFFDDEDHVKNINSHEFRILMAIYRKTTGQLKPSEAISAKHFREMTGIVCNKCITKNLRSLEKKGYISISRGIRPDGRMATNQYSLGARFEMGGNENA